MHCTPTLGPTHHKQLAVAELTVSIRCLGDVGISQPQQQFQASWPNCTLLCCTCTANSPPCARRS